MAKNPNQKKGLDGEGDGGKGLGESGMGGGEGGGLVVSDFLEKIPNLKKHFCRGWGRGNLFFIN